MTTDLRVLTIYFTTRGSPETGSQDIFRQLCDWSMKKLNKTLNARKGSISVDLDAFSVVVSTRNMEKGKEALRRYLLSFGGSSPARCGFPLMTTGSRTKDSIFGCNPKSGQHLPEVLRGKEMLVLDTPVKIALHVSCKERLVNWLSGRGFYFEAASDKTGLCF